MNQKPDDASGKYGEAQPGDVIVFMSALLVGIVVVVTLVFGFFWYMWHGN